MRPSIHALIFLLFTFSCAAKTAKSTNTSPDGRYTIVVANSEDLGLVYNLVKVANQKVLLSFSSSYQFATDGASAVTDTEAANTIWSDDSRFVAIEEYNRRFGGTVLVGFVFADESAQKIPIPLDDILKISGERWKQRRLWLAEGWTAPGRLSVAIAGTAFQDKVSGDTLIDGEVSYGVTLQLQSSFSIVSELGRE